MYHYWRSVCVQSHPKENLLECCRSTLLKKKNNNKYIRALLSEMMPDI